MANSLSFEEASSIFNQPLISLLDAAHTVHKREFDPNKIQISTLLSIKTGSCPENCSYCPQSAHYNTGLKKEPLMEKNKVIECAEKAKKSGSTRFCLGAAWKSPTDKDLLKVCEMVKEIKKIGLESCVTLGMLKEHQIKMLEDAGLDFYNHNIDTSEEFYNEIITTHSFKDRINTIENVSKSKIKVCCGGIIGMGESNDDRIKMLLILANLKHQPESVPINKLIKIKGTPLSDIDDVDIFDIIRV
ncbi:MAG: biotin synthase BioB, partial [Anaplasmataceae bacterium]|nr:biotin synthase BioB [Anaplasmataceae bacterium]